MYRMLTQHKARDKSRLSLARRMDETSFLIWIITESKEVTNKSNKSSKKLEPGSCLDLASGSGEHSCDGRSCVRIQSFQRKDLANWFGDFIEKEKS